MQMHARNSSSLASILFFCMYRLKRSIKLLLNLGYLLSTSAESIEQLLQCVSAHSPLSLPPRCLSHAYRLSMLFAACQRGPKDSTNKTVFQSVFCHNTFQYLPIFLSFHPRLELCEDDVVAATQRTYL